MVDKEKMRQLMEEVRTWAERTETSRKNALSEVGARITHPMVQRYIDSGRPDQYLFQKFNGVWDLKTNVTLENRSKVADAIEDGTQITREEVLTMVGESAWNQNTETRRIPTDEMFSLEEGNSGDEGRIVLPKRDVTMSQKPAEPIDPWSPYRNGKGGA